MENIEQDLKVRLSHIISGSVVNYFHYADLYPNQKVRCPVLVLTLRSSGSDPLKEFSNLPSLTNRRPRPRSYFLILALVAKQLGRRREDGGEEGRKVCNFGKDLRRKKRGRSALQLYKSSVGRPPMLPGLARF